MDSSQFPSRDTVPLNFYYSFALVSLYFTSKYVLMACKSAIFEERHRVKSFLLLILVGPLSMFSLRAKIQGTSPHVTNSEVCVDETARSRIIFVEPESWDEVASAPTDTYCNSVIPALIPYRIKDRPLSYNHCQGFFLMILKCMNCKWKWWNFHFMSLTKNYLFWVTLKG
jgi:hypothetical protein